MALIGIVCATLDFTFNSPRNIEAESEFDVTIEADVNENYDVKIYVYDDTQEYSEIYDGQDWKSSHFYIQDVFPSQDTFKVRAHYLGDTEICVQLRKTGTTSIAGKVCSEITVTASSDSNNGEYEDDNSTQPNENNESGDYNETEDSGDGNLDNSDNNPQNENNYVAPQNPDNSILNKKIVLNTVEEEDSSEKAVFSTKQQKVRTGVLYSFIGLLVLIVVLLSLRKL